MGFSRDVGRYRKAIPDPFPAREIEDAPVFWSEREHVGELRPGEADAREIACTVDWVDRAEVLLVEPLGPPGRIVVNSDRATRAAHVDMMGKREIAKAEVSGDCSDRLGELVFASEFANISDEFFYAIEHPPRAAFRNATEEGSKAPQPQRSFLPRAASQASQALATAAQTTERLKL